jgi:hypothetical protein
LKAAGTILGRDFYSIEAIIVSYPSTRLHPVSIKERPDIASNNIQLEIRAQNAVLTRDDNDFEMTDSHATSLPSFQGLGGGYDILDLVEEIYKEK